MFRTIIGGQSQTSKANPKFEPKKKSEFEFCKARARHSQSLLWETKCTDLKDDAVSLREGCHLSIFGPSSDIHNQVSYSGLSGVGNAGHSDASSLPSETCFGASPYVMKDFAVDRSFDSLPSNGKRWSIDGHASNKGRMRMESGSSYQGLQVLTRISSVPSENSGGNVHSGAPPPWLEATEGIQICSKPVSGDLLSPSNKLKKSNLKRVGATWAEMRKIELEMEKRGESSEMAIKIHPYVSKRMRMDSDGGHASG
ncbi:hypothetical protein L6164_010940 [Bauhinia variegata]|uniref:Uncharacterized protein n=1 Tax=Bauhinia variegata TaxID=167791 RepID=A0ACB9P854_BAUVA|nr:hypothetical protein L6164_010940 [Bauhinia variegata]